MKTLMAFAAMSLLTFQDSHALTKDQLQKCFNRKDAKEKQFIEETSNQYAIRDILLVAQLHGEDADSCDDFKTRVKPIMEDIRYIIGLNIKYRRMIDEEFDNAFVKMEKLKKSSNLSQEILDDLQIYELILSAEKKTEEIRDCSFNKGISVECPEGFYKYVGQNLKELNSTVRKAGEKLSEPANNKKPSTSSTATK